MEESISCIIMGRSKQEKATVGAVHGMSHLNALVLTLFLNLVFLFDTGPSLNSLLQFCRVYITLNTLNNSSAFHKLARSVFSLL